MKQELKQAVARNQLQENVWVEREINWKKEQREKSKKEVPTAIDLLTCTLAWPCLHTGAVPDCAPLT